LTTRIECSQSELLWVSRNQMNHSTKLFGSPFVTFFSRS